MQVNPTIKSRWVEKLRSGTIKQIRGRLNDGTGMCCLGVLCEIAADEGIVKPIRDIDGIDYYEPNSGFVASLQLPSRVLEWSGLQHDEGAAVAIGNYRVTLATHNDDGRSFSEIADAIEQQL
jgi:hypothetical protein